MFVQSPENILEALFDPSSDLIEFTTLSITSLRYEYEI